MSFHNKPKYQIPELIQSLKDHGLEHDKPSQLADSFRTGWMAGRALAAPIAPAPTEPVAWAIFTDAGNARMWTTFQPHVQKLADAEGLTVTPLYAAPQGQSKLNEIAKRRAEEVAAMEIADKDGRFLNAQGHQQAISAIDFCVAQFSQVTCVEPVPLTSRQRVLLAQAWTMLEDYAVMNRRVGNDSFADGAEASAHEIKLMLAAAPTPEPMSAPTAVEPVRNCRQCGGPDDVICGGQCRASKGTP